MLWPLTHSPGYFKLCCPTIPPLQWQEPSSLYLNHTHYSSILTYLKTIFHPNWLFFFNGVLVFLLFKWPICPYFFIDSQFSHYLHKVGLLPLILFNCNPQTSSFWGKLLLWNIWEIILLTFFLVYIGCCCSHKILIRTTNVSSMGQALGLFDHLCIFLY